MAAYLAIVSNMRVGQKEIVVTNTSRNFFGGPSVDGGVFTKGIVVADEQGSRFADILEILGDLSDSGEGEEGIVCANGGMSLNHNM